MYRPTLNPRRRLAAAVAGVAVLAMAVPTVASASFRQVNLVSDIPGKAQLTDPNLVNPWGLSAGEYTPLWVADNGMDVSTIYPGAVNGMPISIAPLVVSIPKGAPTGTVYNPTQAFKVWNGSKMAPSLFLFDSEAGVVSGWAGGTAAQVGASVKDAVFKGLALGSVKGMGPLLYATDFEKGKVRVFNGRFHQVSVPGGFRDPGLPAHYAPFGIQNVGGTIYVTFGKQTPGSDDEEDGPGLGVVDAFTQKGQLIMRVATHGVLNAPWGVVQAPAGFGSFGHALLIGNFGDGRIHAFSPTTGHLLGTLRRADGSPIAISGLWGLRFGNGVTGSKHSLLFAAGLDDEAHGLLGEIQHIR